ncbi:MAG: hypothetical protein K2Q09_00880, partial [Phycisphaerales bacterium]|nr:hypothetical protein [Phycisphaerales bacterium]
ITRFSERQTPVFAAAVAQRRAGGLEAIGTLVFKWDETLGRGFTERFEWPEAASPGGYELYVDWKPLTERLWCCAVVKSIDRQGRLYAEQRVSHAVAITDDTLKHFTATPVVGTADPFRGLLEPRRAVNYDGDGAATAKNADGTIRAHLPPSDSVPRSAWDTAGWTLSAVLVGSLGLAWYFRRRHV